MKNPTHITIINEFSRLLKSFKNKKHTIRYESALALNSVAQTISPKLDIIGYCGLDGKPKDTFIASTEESCRYLTISNDGSLKFSNKLEDIEGNPYSPIFRVYSLKDYINKNIKTLDGSKKYDIYEYINER